ncbi:MAG: YopX family protein [Defluviitaleaceae bacterium]|nr:YopX family protein [Defluviitaleaceae bacterium]
MSNFFRAWTGEKMVYFKKMEIIRMGLLFPNINCIPPENMKSIMHSKGTMDTEGVLVFDSDIVKVTHKKKRYSKTYIITSCAKHGFFTAYENNENKKIALLDSKKFFIKVVGNIFEGRRYEYRESSDKKKNKCR